MSCGTATRKIVLIGSAERQEISSARYSSSRLIRATITIIEFRVCVSFENITGLCIQYGIQNFCDQFIYIDSKWFRNLFSFAKKLMYRKIIYRIALNIFEIEIVICKFNVDTECVWTEWFFFFIKKYILLILIILVYRVFNDHN